MGEKDGEINKMEIIKAIALWYALGDKAHENELDSMHNCATVTPLRHMSICVQKLAIIFHFAVLLFLPLLQSGDQVATTCVCTVQ